MPVLRTQQDFRRVRQLPFCYLCGKPFVPGKPINRDHLPPTGLFRPEDRDIPLILPTHEACNAREHVDDELLALFIAQIEGWTTPSKHRYLDARAARVDGHLFTASKDLNIHRFIVRCIRGFHAALYGEWLPPDTGNSLHPPLIGAAINSQTGKPIDPVQEALLGDSLLNEHALFVSVLKKSRYADRTDKVVCCNGKCIYECVWAEFDNGQHGCVFGLKIYNWHRFGELAGYTPRGCVGVYSPRSGAPANAAKESKLEFQFPNREMLDPFGE